MANILDIRRRIRSVKNTRQITKAMQMVSAAKLRRAQERALAARPYAQMLTNVLKSLVSRAEVYDPVTGEARHPLLIRRRAVQVSFPPHDSPPRGHEQVGKLHFRKAPIPSICCEGVTSCVIFPRSHTFPGAKSLVLSPVHVIGRIK